MRIQLLGWYLGVCLAQSQGSNSIIAFQGRSKLCNSLSCYSHSVSALVTSSSSLQCPPWLWDSIAVSVPGYPAWPAAPSRGKTPCPPPFLGVSMLFDPFRSIQCHHLLANPLISPRCRTAPLREAGRTLWFPNQLGLLAEARAAGGTATALLRVWPPLGRAWLKSLPSGPRWSSRGPGWLFEGGCPFPAEPSRLLHQASGVSKA